MARRIRKFIQDLRRTHATTILMTTHYMQEAESLCEQVAFMKDGIIKAFGTPHDLKQKLRLGDTIRIQFSGPLSLEALENMPGLYSIQMQDSSCRLVVDDQRRRLPQILDFFIHNNIVIDEFSIQESDLEDVFITLAG
jgi:ABC-2 type transport system ATP-binding protein